MKKLSSFISFISILLCLVCIVNEAYSFETIEIKSDKSWLLSTTEINGWQNTNFDDSEWINVSSPNPICTIWCTYQITDGITVNSMWSSEDDYAVYLRKTFYIDCDFNIDSAVMYSNSDDDHEVYINGMLVASDMNGSTGPLLITDIRQYLSQGKNVVAIYGQDSAYTNKSVHFYSKIDISEGFLFSDSDKDGVIDKLDTCPNTPTGSWVNNKGCPSTNSGLYTEEQMNNMVQTILQWGDMNGDAKIDMLEAIHALRISSGVTKPNVDK